MGSDFLIYFRIINDIILLIKGGVMKKDAYIEWLKNKGIEQPDGFINKTAKIEKYYGDIDEIYENDKCQSLLKIFTYTAHNMKNKEKANHKIPFVPNEGSDEYYSIYKGTGDYKSRVTRYIEFREDIDNDIKYAWFVGANQNGVDLTDEFINNGVWVNGDDQKENKYVKEMKAGDKIAIKSTFTEKNNLPFDCNNQSVSVMYIKAIGEVISNDNNGKSIKVNWKKLTPYRKWYFFTFRGRIWKVESENNGWMYSDLIEFTFKNKQQNVKAFLEHPFWYDKYTNIECHDEDRNDKERNDEKYDKQDFLNDVFISDKYYDVIVKLLERKKNIILQGAPGVGKTFAAKRLAYSIMGAKDKDKIGMTQFHQSYSYEDFIMGFRPNGNGFELREGLFLEFCKEAKKEENKYNKYFFIIDEINRGNLSKIFGELFMLIEGDKRGKEYAIKLLYNGEEFYIPSNVYIIGMLNTADKSLAMLDYALRRRFAFVDMIPAYENERFKEYIDGFENQNYLSLIDTIIELNKEISNDTSLGNGFRIGHSYLMMEDTGVIDDDFLNSIIDYEVTPLLEEYWFDDLDKVEEWVTRLKRAIR